MIAPYKSRTHVAVAEKVSALRTEIYLHERIRRADHEETLRILDLAVMGDPPMEGDELLPGGLPFAAQRKQVQPPPPDLESASEISKPAGRATPQFGKLKRRLERMNPG
jgi:hypothetical protein